MYFIYPTNILTSTQCHPTMTENMKRTAGNSLSILQIEDPPKNQRWAYPLSFHIHTCYGVTVHVIMYLSLSCGCGKCHTTSSFSISFGCGMLSSL